MQYPGTDISALTDKNGRFNAGLTLDSKLKEPSAWNLVCMQWSTLNGTSWSGWIGPETDVTP